MTGDTATSVQAPERALISVPDIAPTASKAVCVRFSPAEHADLAAAAADRGLSVPELLRRSWHLAQHVEERAKEMAR